MIKLILALIFISNLAYSSEFEVEYLQFKNEKIRTGIIHTSVSEAKANIIYLQGLGDSMMNHMPLFTKLSDDGFNVIAFDYIGQGGSSGSMNKTTISNIGTLTDIVWKHYVKDDSKKNLLGWSTGGLAAYRYAYKNPYDVKSLALMAPGVVPALVVGDKFVITEYTLTSQSYRLEDNPHIDQIRPTSPIKVPVFAANLLGTALFSRFWKINESIKSMALFGSHKDSYINTQKSYALIEKNNPHFDLHMYDVEGALHELDNEIPEVSEDVHERILRFFN